MKSNLKTLSAGFFIVLIFTCFTYKTFPVTDIARYERPISYIGEVKGKSYIKIDLEPVIVSSAYGNIESGVLKYKGAYYESVSSKKYALTGEFNLEDRVWTFRGFNSNDQLIFIFTGKQTNDGIIEGSWRNKKEQFQFYLKPAG